MEKAGLCFVCSTASYRCNPELVFQPDLQVA